MKGNRTVWLGLFVAGVLMSTFGLVGKMIRPTALVDSAEDVAEKTHSSQLRRQELADEPFWMKAQVPSSKLALPAAPEIRFEVSPREPVAYPQELARLVASEEFQHANTMVADWFEHDASSARDWLAAQEKLDAFQPAMAMISAHLADVGQASDALLWVQAMQPGSWRDQAMLDVYTIGARQHLFTPAQLQAAPVSESQRALLMSGAPGD